MADNKKNRKPMTTKTKGLIAVAVMLVLTVCLSWLAIAGWKLDGEGVNVLLPWLPMPAGKTPASLTVSLDLGEGNSNDISYRYTAEPTAEPTATPAPEEAVEEPVEIVVPESTTPPEEGTGNSDAATQAPAEAVTEAVTEAVGEAAEAVTEAAQEAVEAATEAVTEAVEEAAEAVTEAAAEATATPAPTAVPAEFKPVVEKAAQIIEKRIRSMGRSATVSVIGNNILRISYPKYINVNTSEDIAAAIENQAISTGVVQVKDAAGAVVLDNSAFKSFRVDFISSGYGNYFRTIVDLTNEARKTLEARDDLSALRMTFDGTEMGTMGNLYNGGKVYLGFSTSSAAYSYGAMMVNEPLPVQAVAHSDGTAPAAGGLLTVILIVMWALFILACLYMILKNRLAGVAASWSLWLFMIFMFFLIATVALPTLTLVNWIAVILCLVCAAYLAIYQLRGMDGAAVAGKTGTSAVKGGFQSTLKYVMIVHGGWFVLSLLLMIFPFSREFGYILCCGVLSSLASVVCLNRLLTPACVIAGGNKSSDVSAKAAK